MGVVCWKLSTFRTRSNDGEISQESHGGVYQDATTSMLVANLPSFIPSVTLKRALNVQKRA
jgi:hypothetical protein